MITFKQLYKTIVCLFLFLFFSTVVLIMREGLHDKIAKTDVGIILGSKVNPDGSPSPRLMARLNKGINLYQQGFIANIIVSGGTGKEGVNGAIVMKNYLVTHHIPKKAIIMDNHGNTTGATARNSATLMHIHGFKRAMVISQYFHLTRARLALQHCGISPVYTAHADYFSFRDVYSIAREVAGFYYYSLVHPDCK